MPHRRIYLSGPMTGFPDYNYPLFNAVAAELREAGYAVFNPAEFPHDPDGTFPIRKAFAAYSKFICEEADQIVMLPGFVRSVGAMAELSLARCCGLEAVMWPTMSKVL